MLFLLFSSRRSSASNKKSTETVDEAILSFIKSQTESTETDDPLKLYFLSVYAAVKTFSKLDQLKIKKLINAAISDVEESNYLLNNDFN